MGFGQLESEIIDSITGEKIPYVNIWIENESIGTTSNEEGAFSLDITNGEFLILSCLGYETKRVEISNVPTSILLHPKVTELEAVSLSKAIKQKEITIGKFKDTDVQFYYATLDKPEIKARFFPFDSSYVETPYLKTLKFRTYSSIRNAKFNIRLYAVGENGEPTHPIYENNIIGITKKGAKNIELDVSDLNILFPKNGLFVSYEWLIIKENEFTTTFPITDSKERIKQTVYEPKVGLIASETNENGWKYVNGKWQKVEIFSKGSAPESYVNKFGLLAIEMSLTN